MQPIEALYDLPPAAQLINTGEHAYYLAARPAEEPALNKLYQVGELFVKILFQNPSEVEVVRVFRELGLLLPYLDQLNLNTLLGAVGTRFGNTVSARKWAPSCCRKSSMLEPLWSTKSLNLLR